MTRTRSPRSAEPRSDGRGSGATRTAGGTPPSGPPRSPRASDSWSAKFIGRQRVLWVLIAIVCLAISGRMVYVHVIAADSISAQAAQQRSITNILPAIRGSIVDRAGRLLAHSDDARALTFQPKAVRKQIAEAHAKDPAVPDVDTRLGQIADGVSSALGGSISSEDLLTQFKSDKDFVYLARLVSIETTKQIQDQYPEVGAERQSNRLYPGGSLAANIVGDVNFDGNGSIGLESSLDSVLAGTNGTETYDQGRGGGVIPGSKRNVHPAVDGQTVHLTIDSDLQWFVQSQVNLAKKRSGAHNVSAVVLDAKTGQVLAMANDGTFDPSRPLSEQEDAFLGNRPVTSPFEPGSVNKIITAAAALEYGLTTPTEIHQVPGSIRMSGITVNDAWVHGTEPFTTTGIFGKSSNVGTLMLAQKVGEERFADMVAKFGLGERTGIGLPGESPGAVPALSQWSGGSFANLPIGQGLSTTLLQMTSMYQAIANGGVRIQPRIIASEDEAAAGVEPPKSVRVVSPKTAKTALDMFRAVMQDDPSGVQSGTGAKGAIAGYQTAGKTGTAQQVDPKCNCYSRSSYNITFAGIAPADDPRFVVGIMMDNPVRSSDGTGGQSAAPLFSTVGSWLLRHDKVPFSSRPTPQLRLMG
ncbi:peptidoglycan D,D-transpeptidase FtsI family protein [Gordonia hydrophobica]|uniref:Penicillin-binding protein 2 n=1 Tax=Gordonia hydrophobica TaxID=40516 RepID=A0ABZ2TYH9_9ACTN|nr:penicillin-binding protein 2 [Gordonia hydrophobica]MBM7367109.1 cell division protein FtsI (penicillin-binding protein 3) [Gordonia hydrophobica]